MKALSHMSSLALSNIFSWLALNPANSCSEMPFSLKYASRVKSFASTSFSEASDRSYQNESSQIVYTFNDVSSWALPKVFLYWESCGVLSSIIFFRRL